MTTPSSPDDIRNNVREHYSDLAASRGSKGCCSPAAQDCCSPTIQIDRIYETPDAAALPEEVTGLSLGCGDPITLSELQPGQTVLDLGSGGGIDCFLAARKVGPAGRVIGVDMTPAMLDRARANRERLGLDNVEFRLGEIEHLPVGDATVDVVISNCVINLSPDKPQVLREAFRVLRPGGKLAVSDVATDGPLPQSVKDSLSAWAGCIAGALDVGEYREAIEAAGFIDVHLEPVYLDRESIDEALSAEKDMIDPELLQDEQIYRTVFSTRITARKP